MEDNVIDFAEEEKAIAEGDMKEMAEAPMTQEEFEGILTETGILMPASDVHHYMVRNSSYMKLIESDEFKASGLSLEEILDDDFIKDEQSKAQTNIGIMRYVTEQVIAKMNATELKDTDEPQEIIE